MSLLGDDQTNWLEPWHRIEGDGQHLVAELAREVGPSHPLFGLHAIPLGRRRDSDDVLFALPESQKPLALVHLTWSGRRETDSQWPFTKFFSSWDDWIEQGMKPDHREYQGDAEPPIQQ